MGFKVLNYVKYIAGFVPEVQKPEKLVPFKEKFLWTVATLLIFLVCSQVPLYGIQFSNESDPWYRSRMVMASNRGTLMELGISPILTSGLIIQLLSGTKIIDVDQNNKEEAALLEVAQKISGIAVTLFQAAIYVGFGMYGDVRVLGINAVLIVFQLFLAGVLVILLDELLQKGYGLGSAISFFIATNICETIIWSAFSPNTVGSGVSGVQFEGSILAFFHLLITRPDKLKALTEAFYRKNLPNLANLLATFMIFATVVYFQGFRVDIPVTSKRMRGHTGVYPIKLFYTNNIPIILQTALVSNFFFLSQLLYKYFPNFIIGAIGTWQENPYQPQQIIPVGGFAYYISPPANFRDAVSDPIHSFIYAAFVLATCALFSRIWISISGSAPADVSKQLKDQQLMIRGHRDDSTIHILDRYIPTAAALGGLCIGILSITADFMGAIGSGTGILLAVTTIYSTFETAIKEQAKTGESLGMGMFF
ncbi:protein transport protein Sec61 subunit alpha-like [Schistocerca gregaria]|uniref:protein transport protein Sec61 subunit alpha-like n=1 Tax=Schistocerca gregaria TaxID=7010 RepID=UPI00211EB460|nr:protein transport protein Sec61 subunit alpha-like [Schistocerca gregaria]